jgi:hypothetical protein
MPDQQFPILVLAMFGIVKRDLLRIVEAGQRLIERDAVLGEIGLCLVVVSLELHSVCIACTGSPGKGPPVACRGSAPR